VSDIDHHLDVPIWGAEDIGREAGLIDEDGNVDKRKVFYLLEKEKLPAAKVGRSWVTTRRRLREVFAATWSKPPQPAKPKSKQLGV
jgi:hypothetical protein